MVGGVARSTTASRRPPDGAAAPGRDRSASASSAALSMTSAKIAEMEPESGGFVDVEFVVEPNYAGWRLDRYLCHKIRRLSRAKVQRIIERSLVSDRPLKTSPRVRPRLIFVLGRRALAEAEPPTELPEVFRDDCLLVLDKPAGLPIHP